MPSVEFWRPRLRGARFDNGEIPLQALSDLSALREMVIEVAKWRFLLANPERQRVPRGFADKVNLKLAGVADGSAVPIINITTDEQILPGSVLPYQDVFVQARDDIADLVASASDNGHAPAKELPPPRFLAYFNRIGHGLRDGESLELPRANGLPPAMLTTETRQRLLQHSTVREITKELTLRGTVPEADQERMTFELQQIHGGRVAGSMPEEHHDVIIEAFNGYRNHVRIMVNGVGRYDRQGRLSSLGTIQQVTPLDPLDVPARLDELRAMQDGWLDGAGKAPSPQGLDWLSASFERYYPDDVQLPFTYPTPKGGIRLEWTLGSQDISLEVDLMAKTATWHRLDVADLSDDGEEQELNLDDADGWDWVSRNIVRLSEESK